MKKLEKTFSKFESNLSRAEANAALVEIALLIEEICWDDENSACCFLDDKISKLIKHTPVVTDVYNIGTLLWVLGKYPFFDMRNIGDFVISKGVNSEFIFQNLLIALDNHLDYSDMKDATVSLVFDKMKDLNLLAEKFPYQEELCSALIEKCSGIK